MNCIDAPVPSPQLGIASIVKVLGLAGLALGKIRDAISPLSAVGTIVCLTQMYLFCPIHIMQFF